MAVTRINDMDGYCRDEVMKCRMHAQRAKNVMRLYNELPYEWSNARYRILKQLFTYCGENARVNPPFHFDFGYRISLGAYSLINMNCTLLDTGNIVIGKYTLIGPDVKIYTATHSLCGIERYYADDNGAIKIGIQSEPVTVGDYVWIGGGAVIVPGVTIGSNTVIGAGSVVTKSIPENSIACGNPCTVKKVNKPIASFDIS